MLERLEVREFEVEEQNEGRFVIWFSFSISEDYFYWRWNYFENYWTGAEEIAEEDELEKPLFIASGLSTVVA